MKGKAQKIVLYISIGVYILSLTQKSFCTPGTCEYFSGLLSLLFGWVGVFMLHVPAFPWLANPLLNPKIAPSGGWNINGGRNGYTRDSGNQLHDGTDIKADVNTPLYAMHSGTVTGIRDSFQAGEYKKKSYGNYIEITSTINGVEVKLKYNHLNGVDVKVGDIITQGSTIGITGNTGNAQTKNGVIVIPHLHIRARKKINGNWDKSDPENYMSSTFKSDGTSTNTNCN